MAIFIFGLIAVVFFVIGLALIFQGYKNVPDADQIVPKDELNKVQNDLACSKEQEEQFKLQMDSLAVELEKTKWNLQQAQESGMDVDALKAQEEEYQKKLGELQKNLSFLREKADTQAVESIEVISSLHERNEALKTENDSTKGQVDPVALDKLNKEKESLENQVNEQLARVQRLEEECERVHSLTRQNQRLTEGLKQITSKITQFEVAVLKTKPNTGENIEKVKKMNENLLERQKFMQFELTKNRARATGLDELCKEFKAQLEAAGCGGKASKENSAELKEIGPEFSQLQEALEEQNKFSEEIKQRLESYRKKIQLLDEKTKENIALIARLAE